MIFSKTMTDSNNKSEKKSIPKNQPLTGAQKVSVAPLSNYDRQ